MDEQQPISRQRTLYWSVSVTVGILLLGLFCHDKPESSFTKRCYFNENCLESSQKLTRIQSLDLEHMINLEVGFNHNESNIDFALLCPTPRKKDPNTLLQVLTKPHQPVVISFNKD